jgi:hypothetical protein
MLDRAREADEPESLGWGGAASIRRNTLCLKIFVTHGPFEHFLACSA